MDLPPLLFRSGEYVYYIKLVNGDSILAKSDDDQDIMNERGSVELFDIMRMVHRTVQMPNGNITEVQLLAPWMDAVELSTPVMVPIETMLAIAVAKPEVASKYQAFVLASKIKELKESGDFDREAEDGPISEIEDAMENDRHQKAEHSKSITIPQGPRKPELLTRESLAEAEANGDIEEPKDEKRPEPEPEPHYRKHDITYH